jgi:hypothetical protein
MKVGYYIPAGEVFEPLRLTLREVFGSVATEIDPENLACGARVIDDSEVLLIDVTGLDALAIYILGMARRSSARVQLLSAIKIALPGPFAEMRVIVHGWNMEHVRAKLSGLAAQAEAALDTGDDSPSGQFARMFGDLLRKHGYEHRGAVEFDGKVFTLHEQEMDLALVQEIANRGKAQNVRVRLL